MSKRCENEDNDDNDDVEEFARNSIPVLDTDRSYQMRLARNCFFFVGKGMVYGFLLIILFNNVYAMILWN